MRKIDADALLKRVQQEEIQAQAHGREFSTCFMSPGGTPSTEWWYVEDLIENAPTIELRCEECEAFNKTRLLIPQPERKRGKWIDAVLPNDSGGLQVQVCNQCNTFFPLAYTGGGHNFCPNCGADMRGDDNE